MSNVEQAAALDASATYTGPPPTIPPDGSESVAVNGPGPGRGRTAVRRRVGPLSLTSRLVSGVVILVVVVVLFLSSATYFALKSFLDERFAQQLQQTSSQNTGFFDRCLDDAVPTAQGNYRCFIGPQTQQQWVLASNGSATYTFRPDYGSDLKALSLTSGQLKALRADPDQALTVEQGGVELQVTAGIDRRDNLLVATGLATDDLHRTLHRLLAIEIIIGGLAVLVTILATTYGVGFGLRKLRRVTATAQEVAAELSPEGAGLDRRVPDDEPETEVGQLATSFNTMLAAVETQFAARLESEHRMRQFLADASHELRTPLTSIRGYAELARMQRAAGDTSDDNLDRIEFEGTRMSRLVEDLLVLARDDADGSSRRNPELIDLAGLLDDAVSGSRAAFPGRRIEMSFSGDPHVVGDRDQLLRVVRNLVNNAAVHTDPARPITVRAFLDATSANGVSAVIQVLDGGPGLSPDEAAHVFERFWRADKARTRVRGGSGLGLSIVASIVRAHGGTVHFDSGVETGSTMTVVLPAAESDFDVL